MTFCCARSRASNSSSAAVSMRSKSATLSLAAMGVGFGSVTGKRRRGGRSGATAAPSTLADENFDGRRDFASEVAASPIRCSIIRDLVLNIGTTMDSLTSLDKAIDVLEHL